MRARDWFRQHDRSASIDIDLHAAVAALSMAKRRNVA
jgi:hypothetical protein